MATDDKLNEILDISDKTQRQNALTEYAQSLRVNYLKANKDNGEMDEDELTVMIYDAQQGRIKVKNQIIGVAIGALIVALIGGAMMFLFGNFMAPSIEETIFERVDE